jgi:hypothetical protein
VTERRAPLGPTIALAASLALGAVFVLAPLVWWVMPTTDLPEPFPTHHQDAENLIFILAFAVLLPLGVLASTRIADRIAAGPNGDSLSSTAAALCAGLALVVIVTRVSAELPWGGGPDVLCAGAIVWCAAGGLVLRRVAAPDPWDILPRAARQSSGWWLVAGLTLVPLALAFTDLGSISVPVAVVGAAGAAAIVAARDRVRWPAVPGWLRLTLDLSVGALLLLAVPNVAIFESGDAFETSIIQFHQNFYLGPANQILAGDAMLVDVLSQYGVGSIYFIAGVFSMVPIGNGTLGLLEGVLSAIVFVATFATLRIAGVSRLIAASTMAVAVVVLVYGLQYPIGSLLQHGAIRFGVPVGVVLGAVTEARWPRVATPARVVQLLTVAVASVWALEAFAYTLLTAMVVAVLGTATRPAGRRRALLVRWGVQLLAAIAFAHLVLAGGTLAATGELPDWGWYLNTLREFLVGTIGDLTYDFTSFSPGLAVGGLYLISAAAVILIVLRRPDLRVPQQTILIAIGGMTAYGVALLSYIVNRSADHIIPYVCLPAFALGALWLELLSRPDLDVPVAGRRMALGTALSVSGLLVAVAWSSADTRYSQSALAHVVPGGPSLTTALDDLRNPPPLLAEATDGESLLDEYLPDEPRSIVLTSADLSVEILMRADRGSAVPLGDPWEDSFVPEQHLDPLEEFVDDLEAGDRALLDAAGREAFDRYRTQPALDPLTDEGTGTLVPSGLASLQKVALRDIGLRFDLRTLVRTASGLEVVELVPR